MKNFKLILFGFSMVVLVGCSKGSSDPKPADDNNKGYGAQTDISIPSVPNKIEFEQSVPSDRVEALKESISILYTIKMKNSDYSVQDMNRLMKIQDSQPATMQKWLEDRVHYIINKEFDLEKHALFSPKTVEYPNAGIIPDVMTGTANEISTNATSDAQVAMSNIGALIYYIGKKQSKLVSFDLGPIGAIPFTSPRTGLLQIGAGLFPDFNGIKVQNVLVDIYRAGILFHEARHSDGHGKTLAFMHAKCPVGHDYAGLSACDAPRNGPYTVGATVHKNLMNSCGTECTQLTKKALQNIYLDQADRTLEYYEYPYKTPGAQAGTDWDDAPEIMVPASPEALPSPTPTAIPSPTPAPTMTPTPTPMASVK